MSNHPTLEGDLSGAVAVTPQPRLRYVVRQQYETRTDRYGGDTVVIGTRRIPTLEQLHQIDGRYFWLDVPTEDETFETYAPAQQEPRHE